MAKVVTSNIQNSLRRPLPCVWDQTHTQVENVPGSGPGEGEQIDSPFHRLDLDVLFDTETSFEFHHGFINTQLVSGSVYFTERIAEIVQQLLYLPRVLSTVASSFLMKWRNRSMCRKRLRGIVRLKARVDVLACVDQ